VSGFPLNFGTIITLAMTVSATFYVLRSVWHVLTALESRSWPTTQGMVRDSALEEDSRSTINRAYRARVSYRFTVDGQEFAGDRAYFGDSVTTSWGGPARKIAERYRAGHAVTVHYDPSRPREAVLEPGISVSLVTILAFEILFLAMAIWMFRGAVAG
jgi:hypothetical protein